jgi:nucleoside-diphosphate-sugar epimerase
MEIYNIGTQNKIKISDLAKLIGGKLNKKIIIEGKYNYSGGTNIRCPNISKIRKLGFKEKILLKDGLDNIIKKMKIDY